MLVPHHDDDLKQPIQRGKPFKASLTFEKAGEVDLKNPAIFLSRPVTAVPCHNSHSGKQMVPLRDVSVPYWTCASEWEHTYKIFANFCIIAASSAAPSAFRR